MDDSLAIALRSTAQPEADPCAPLESLKQLIHQGLEQHEVAARTLADHLLNTLEISVRTGWYLSDARNFLVDQGSYGIWLETNFKCSVQKLYQLRALSNHFARDLTDLEQRKKLGICVKGLPGVPGPHLRNQLTELGHVASLTGLLRLTGVLPTLPEHSGNGSHAGKNNLARILSSLQRRLNAMPPHKLLDAQRQELLRELRPIANYYNALL